MGSMTLLGSRPLDGSRFGEKKEASLEMVKQTVEAVSMAKGKSSRLDLEALGSMTLDGRRWGEKEAVSGILVEQSVEEPQVDQDVPNERKEEDHPVLLMTPSVVHCKALSKETLS